MELSILWGVTRHYPYILRNRSILGHFPSKVASWNHKITWKIVVSHHFEMLLEFFAQLQKISFLSILVPIFGKIINLTLHVKMCEYVGSKWIFLMNSAFNFTLNSKFLDCYSKKCDLFNFVGSLLKQVTWAWGCVLTVCI